MCVFHKCISAYFISRFACEEGYEFVRVCVYVCVCERVITCAQRAKKKVELDIALKWSDRREKGQRLERLLAGDEKHT